MDGRYKLAINLFDEDEFYDLHNDPQELHNCINDPSYATERDRLFAWLLNDMDRCQDPLRGHCWQQRAWNKSASERVFYGQEQRWLWARTLILALLV